jgi:threonyl-tRNA synthetase
MTIIITLLDGSQKHFEKPLTVSDLAHQISPKLQEKAIAAKIDGKLVDTSYLLDSNATLQILTDKDPESLEVIRHSTAHLLAHAVKRLFPRAQVTIGPVIENGFYYDFAFDRAFTPEDLISLEKVMHDIAKEGIAVERSTMTREAAIPFFRQMGEEYKAKIIEDIPAGETLSLYRQNDFIDLCRGPHVPNTGFLKAFKLMKVAGAYWRGDSNNAMLQRIYGTAFIKQKELDGYLFMLEEAEKRDHRKLAKKMDLFHLQPNAPGMVFWHPKGWAIFRAMEEYMRQKLKEYGYLEISTPLMADFGFWEASGHASQYRENMFVTESEKHEFAIKPMSCPMHIQVFNDTLHSYRDLPIRFAEYGCCHRNEPSGTLHGLMRVRKFTQDDGHVFCTEENVQSEAMHFIDMLYAVYKDFGFTDVLVKLSTRPVKRVGSDELWDSAEAFLANALNDKGIVWEENPGEGAFYGPKIEFSLRDSLGRVWQCGTLQLDPFLPQRLSAFYIDREGNKKNPLMLHRAIFGSFERFIGILLEHYAAEGLPLWLAPTQVAVLTITEKYNDYASEVNEYLRNNNIRTELDVRNEKIGFKIREHAMARVPYFFIIGEKEMLEKKVTVRKGEENLGMLAIEEAIVIFKK